MEAASHRAPKAREEAVRGHHVWWPDQSGRVCGYRRERRVGASGPYRVVQTVSKPRGNVPNSIVNDLVNELSEELGYALPKKYQRKSVSSKIRARCRIHKYIRFRSNNKTYRTDTYYCVKCPSTIPIPNIIGRTVECWKCEKAFTIGMNEFMHKPTCENCRGKKTNSNESIVNELMREIEGKL